MDSKKQFLNWKTARRVFQLLLTSVSIGISAGILNHIRINGRHTGECWFHADYQACIFSTFTPAISLVLTGSFLVLDVLIDRETMPNVRRVASWIEAFVAGQLTMLWFGVFMYLLVQWMRTILDFPFIRLDKTVTVCPNVTSVACSIPEDVHAGAAIFITLCGVSFFVWLVDFLVTRSAVREMTSNLAELALSSTLPVREVSAQSNGQLPQQRLSALQPDQESTNSVNESPVNIPPVIMPPVIMPPVSQPYMQHMGHLPFFSATHMQSGNLSSHHMVQPMGEPYSAGQRADFQTQPVSQFQVQSGNEDRNPDLQAPVILPPVTGEDQSGTHMLSHRFNLSLVQGMNPRTGDMAEHQLNSLRARRIGQNESSSQNESFSHTGRYAMLPSEHAV